MLSTIDTRLLLTYTSYCHRCRLSSCVCVCCVAAFVFACCRVSTTSVTSASRSTCSVLASLTFWSVNASSTATTANSYQLLLLLTGLFFKGSPKDSMGLPKNLWCASFLTSPCPSCHSTKSSKALKKTVFHCTPCKTLHVPKHDSMPLILTFLALVKPT